MNEDEHMHIMRNEFGERWAHRSKANLKIKPFFHAPPQFEKWIWPRSTCLLLCQFCQKVWIYILLVIFYSWNNSILPLLYLLIQFRLALSGVALFSTDLHPIRQRVWPFVVFYKKTYVTLNKRAPSSENVSFSLHKKRQFEWPVQRELFWIFAPTIIWAWQ